MERTFNIYYVDGDGHNNATTAPDTWVKSKGITMADYLANDIPNHVGIRFYSTRIAALEAAAHFIKTGTIVDEAGTTQHSTAKPEPAGEAPTGGTHKALEPFVIEDAFDGSVYIHAVQFFTGYKMAHAMDIAAKIAGHHYDGQKISDVYVAANVIDDDLHELQELYAITIQQAGRGEAKPTIRPRHLMLAVELLGKYTDALEASGFEMDNVADPFMENVAAINLRASIKQYAIGGLIDPKK